MYPAEDCFLIISFITPEGRLPQKANHERRIEIFHPKKHAERENTGSACSHLVIKLKQSEENKDKGEKQKPVDNAYRSFKAYSYGFIGVVAALIV